MAFKSQLGSLWSTCWIGGELLTWWQPVTSTCPSGRGRLPNLGPWEHISRVPAPQTALITSMFALLLCWCFLQAQGCFEPAPPSSSVMAHLVYCFPSFVSVLALLFSCLPFLNSISKMSLVTLPCGLLWHWSHFSKRYVRTEVWKGLSTELQKALSTKCEEQSRQTKMSSLIQEDLMWYGRKTASYSYKLTLCNVWRERHWLKWSQRCF